MRGLEVQGQLVRPRLRHDGNTRRPARPRDSPRDALKREVPHLFIPLLDLGNLVNVLRAQRRNRRCPPCLA